MQNQKRLIDAYKLEDLVRNNSARYHHVDDVIAAIAGQPTVDAVEVVHARWVDAHKGLTACKCTACGTVRETETPYCPNCGAKMDGGNEDANTD